MLKSPEVSKAKTETPDPKEELPTDAGKKKGLFALIFKRRPAPEKADGKYRHFKKRKKFTVKKLILMIAIAAAVVGGAYGIWKLFFYEEPVEMITGTTVRDSITTLIEGSASTTPTEFQMLSIPVDGAIDEVYVSQGDTVSVGDPLYSMDTTDVEADIAEMEATIEYYENQLDEYNQNISNMTVYAPYSGKLMDVSVEEGDNISSGKVLATIIDDSKMLLPLYFSYAMRITLRPV
jgi:multidrug efflux pump subunit AcrA (membrane-fusion protein)